ncbi:hypothetical protein ACJJTC_009975 [Scirpophaga incertulas]
MDANDTDAVTLTTMQEQIEELTRTITALSAGDFRGRSRCSCDRNYGTSHHRSQSRRRSRSRPRNRELCWYHDRFGAKAKKCEPDCKWSVIEKDRSDICCFPRRMLKGRYADTGLSLNAANGSSIQTYGKINLNLNLGLRRQFRWDFIIADVDAPIIGSDFLSFFHLLPDCRSGTLRDVLTDTNMNVVDGNTSYLLPLSEIDIDVCSDSALKHTSIPIWNHDHQEYLEYRVYAKRILNNSSEDGSNENYSTYKCIACNLDVPKMFRKLHLNSVKHKLGLELIQKVLERTKDLIISSNNDFDDISQTKNVYFCTACVSAVKVQNKVEHESSKEHFKSILHDKLLKDLLMLYSDKDFLDRVDFDYFNEGCRKNVQDNECVNKNIDIFDTGSKTSAKTKIATKVEVKPMRLNEYIDLLNQNASNNQFMVDGECIKIITLDKAVLKIPEKNLHSFHELDGHTICGACQFVDVDEDIESHKISDEHLKNITVPLKDMHCIREGSIFDACLLCNAISIGDIDLHKESTSHVALLKKALGKDTPIGIHEENTFLEAINKTKKKTAKSYCEPCKLYIDTHNFMNHSAGKTHRKNTRRVENTVTTSNTQGSDVATPSLNAKDRQLCAPCKMYIHPYNWSAHIISINHINNVKATAAEKTYSSANIDFCVTCKKNVESTSTDLDERKTPFVHCENCRLTLDKDKSKVQSGDVDVNINSIVQSVVDKIVKKIFKSTDRELSVLENLKQNDSINKDEYLTNSDVIMKTTDNEHNSLPAVNPDMKAKSVVKHIAMIHDHIELLSDKNAVFCNVCAVKIPNTVNNITSHVDGNAHKSNFDRIVKSLHIHLKAKGNKIWCLVCNINVKVSDLFEHVYTTEHVKEFEALLNYNYVYEINNIYFCVKCLKELEDISVLGHLKLKRHRKCEHVAGISKTHLCEFCRVNVPVGPKNVAFHYMGRAHKKNSTVPKETLN